MIEYRSAKSSSSSFCLWNVLIYLSCYGAYKRRDTLFWKPVGFALYQTSFSSMLQAVAMFCLIKKLHEATPFLYKQISIKSSARVAIFLTRIAIRNCSDDIQIFLNCLWVVINSVCHSSAGNMQFQLLSFSEYILSANFSFHLSKSLWPIGNGQQLWLSGSEI